MSENRFRKWTLEDLIEKVSDTLYEFEGIETISKRTIQNDIQMMRSDKLGYFAPIVVLEKNIIPMKARIIALPIFQFLKMTFPE